MKDYNPWLTAEIERIGRYAPTSLRACLLPLLLTLGVALATDKDDSLRQCLHCGRQYETGRYCTWCHEDYKANKRDRERE